MAAPEGNKYAEGNNGGRPPKFETPEQLETACQEYFDLNGSTLTITGLAMYLGFDSRQSLYDYEKREEFSFIIKAARLAVENSYEKSLRTVSVAGAIFALKNMGWRDKVETGFTDNEGKDREITGMVIT
jgi:DNA-packaging protein gp3